MSNSFDFDEPDHFTAGAVGPPGERVFYLQARQHGEVVTLRCEKEHVRLLAEHIGRLLARLQAAGEEGGRESEGAPADLDLLEPIEAVWVVGALGLGYDEEQRRVVVVANELIEKDEEREEQPEQAEEGATARFRLSPVQAAAFVEQAAALMRAGRPICPLCSLPKDPSGHVCPRTNGHLARA
jgi:uncharacterized repeat protein (TIGR03847 family)